MLNQPEKIAADLGGSEPRDDLEMLVAGLSSRRAAVWLTGLKSSRRDTLADLLDP